MSEETDFVVRIILEAIDRAGPAIRDLNRAVDDLKSRTGLHTSTTDQLSQGLGKVDQSAQDAASSHGDLADQATRAGQAHRSLASDLDRARASVSSMPASTDQSTSAMAKNEAQAQKLSAAYQDLKKNADGLTFTEQRRAFQSSAADMNALTRSLEVGSASWKDLGRNADEAKKLASTAGLRDEAVRTAAAYQDFSTAVRAGKMSIAEAKTGYQDFAVQLDRIRDAFPRTSQEAQKFGSLTEDALKRVKRAAEEVGGGGSALGNLFRGLEGGQGLQAIKNFGNSIDNILPKLVSMSAYLRGLGLALAAGLMQQLDTAVVGLAGGFGLLVAGISQAVPVFGILAGALSGLRSVFAAVSAAQALQQQQATSTAQTQVQSLSATNAVISAQQQLQNSYVATRNAQFAVTQSQIALTTARLAAQRQIQDLMLAERAAELQAKGAAITLAQAQQNLQLVIQQGGTGATLQAAELGVQQAQLGQQGANVALPRARMDYAQARSLGVGGAQSVVQATQAVQQANQGLIQAQQSAAAAARALHLAQLQASGATSAIAQSQSNLNYLISQLSPVEKKIYELVLQLQKIDLSPITDRVLAPVVGFLRQLITLANDPKLIGPLEKLASALGAGIGRILSAITSKQGVSFFETMANDATKNVPLVINIILGLMNIFQAIAKDAAPALHQILGDIGTTLNGWSDWLNKHGPEVRQFFHDSLTVIETILGVLGQLVVAMVKAFDPGSIKALADFITQIVLPALYDVVKIVGFITEGFLTVVDSIDRFVSGFTRVIGILHPVKDLVEAIAAAFISLLVINRVIGAIETARGVLGKLTGGRIGGAATGAGVAGEIESAGVSAGGAMGTSIKAAGDEVAAVWRETLATGGATAGAEIGTAEVAGGTTAAAEIGTAEATGGIGAAGVVGAGAAGAGGVAAGGLSAAVLPIALAVGVAFGLDKLSHAIFGDSKITSISQLTQGGFNAGVLNPKIDAPLASKFLSQSQSIDIGNTTIPANQLAKLRQEAENFAKLPDITTVQRKGLRALIEQLDPANIAIAQAGALWGQTFAGINATTGNVMQQVQAVLKTDIANISANLGTGTLKGAQALAATITAAWNTVLNNTNESVNGISKGLQAINRMLNSALSKLGQAPLSLVQQSQLTPGILTGLLSGQLTSGGVASPHAVGGYERAQSGGKIIQVAEGGYDEVVLTTDPSKADRQRMLLGQYLQRAPHVVGYASGGFTLDGHPGNIQPGLHQVIAAMESQWPGLSVTATTDGTHVPNSYHYRGEAVDMASGDYAYMNKAAEWVKSSGMYRSLVEGIHNPNLAIYHGGIDTPPGPFGAVWAGHLNHIHLAITGALGHIAGGAAGASGTTAASIKAPIVGAVGAVGAVAQAAINRVTDAANKFLAGVSGQQTAPSSAVTSPSVSIPGGGTAVGNLNRIFPANTGAALSAAQVIGLAADAHMYRPDLWEHVAFAESSLEPGQVNSIGATGLWQIYNHPDLVAKYGNMRNPWNNVRAAYDLSSGGRNMSPWDASRNAGDGGGWGKYYRDGGLIKAAGGFNGMVDHPTLILAGEAGREHVGITPMSDGGLFRSNDYIPGGAGEGRPTVSLPQTGSSGVGYQTTPMTPGPSSPVPVTVVSGHGSSRSAPTYVAPASSPASSGSSGSSGASGGHGSRAFFDPVGVFGPQTGFTSNPPSLAAINWSNISSIGYVFKAVQQGFAALSRISIKSADFAKNFIPFVDSLLTQDTGVLDRLNTAFTVIQNMLSAALIVGGRIAGTGLGHPSYLRGLPAAFRTGPGGVVSQALSPGAQAGEALTADRREQTFLLGEQRIAEEALAQVSRRLDRARALVQSDPKKYKSLVTSLTGEYNNLVNRVQTLTGAIAQGVAAIFQAEQTRIQNALTDIQTTYSLTLATSPSGAAPVAAVTSSLSAMQGLLKHAIQIGDKQLQLSIVQGITQLFSDAASALDSYWATRTSGVNAGDITRLQSFAQNVLAKQAYGASGTGGPVSAAAATLFASQANSGVLSGELGGYQSLLAQAQKSGNVPAIQSLTDKIKNLQEAIAENNQAILDNTSALITAKATEITSGSQFGTGVYSGLAGILQSLGTITGAPNVAGLAGLLGQSNRTLSGANSGLAGLLSSMTGGAVNLQGLSGQGLVSAVSGLNLPALEMNMSQADRANFEGLLNAIIQNDASIQQNTQQLATLNGQLMQPQSWSTTAWTQFRNAIFSGMGNLLPQYQSALPSGSMPAAGSFSPISSGRTTTIGDVNITHPVETLNPEILGQQLAYHMSSAL